MSLSPFFKRILKMTKKKIQCINCYHFEEYYDISDAIMMPKNICGHPSNVRYEHGPIKSVVCYLRQPEDINKNSDCPNFSNRKNIFKAILNEIKDKIWKQ